MTPGRHAVWAAATAAYVIAIFHRSSMSVAGLVAAERFDAGPATLSAFVALQIVVYTAMQMPSGMIIDRIGPRWSLVGGSTLMALGQVGFALSTSVPIAVMARVVVGCGDSLIFICALRLIVQWYRETSIRWMNQLTGLAGQVGALVASVPMTLALTRLGWTATYLLAAAIGVAAAIAVLVLVRDDPTGKPRQPIRYSRGVGDVRTTLRIPVVRLGFWIHAASSFSSVTFMLLWGHPFLVSEGMTDASASTVISIGALGLMTGSVFFGRLRVRDARHRVVIVQSVIAGQVAVWSLVLLWPGAAPAASLALLSLVLGFATPASFLGFDAARAAIASGGTAVNLAIVNQGGFLVAVVMMSAIGLVLQVADVFSVEPSTAYMTAMSLQIPVLMWASLRIGRLGPRKVIETPPGCTRE